MFFSQPRSKQDLTDQLSCALYYIYYTIKFSNRGEQFCQKSNQLSPLDLNGSQWLSPMDPINSATMANCSIQCHFLASILLLFPPNLAVVANILGTIKQMNGMYKQLAVCSIFHSQNGESYGNWLKFQFCEWNIEQTIRPSQKRFKPLITYNILYTTTKFGERRRRIEAKKRH